MPVDPLEIGIGLTHYRPKLGGSGHQVAASFRVLSLGT